MNCVNCGAPMELFARRRYYFCRHCGTFHFLDAPEMDGLQVLARPHDALTCTHCQGTLAKALLDQTHTIDYCERCRGVLVSRRTFAEVVVRRRAWATNAPVDPLPPDRAELARQISCPGCGGPMEAHPYYGPGHVVIDSCGTCDLVWLDLGELDQIVNAPGRDRGRRDAPPPTATIESPAPADEDSGRRRSGRVNLVELLDTLFSD